MKKDILNDDTGRSMVEMLGTLAIIGVLSVGGVAGYNSAMNRMKANEVIDEANKRALVVAMSIAAGGGQEKESVSLAEFKNNEIAGAKFDTVATMQDGLYQIKITNLPRKVYALVKASLGAKSGVKISEPCEPAGDSCSAFFYFDENLRSDPQATNGGSSAADSASQTAAPNYYCDPIDNGRVCREDKPADCERCNGTCAVNAYGPLADICQPFKYTCNDTGLTKNVGSGVPSSGYPCTCKAEDSGYFNNDEQARAALCNSKATALKEYYCAGNSIKPVTKSGEPEGSWGVCLRPTSCLDGNRGYYANLNAAIDDLCNAAAVPDGAYYCYADGKTVGNGNGANTCSDGYSCVPGEVSRYDGMDDAKNELCKPASSAQTYGPNYCAGNANTVCQYTPSGYSTCMACPTGKYCTPGDTSDRDNLATDLCTGGGYYCYGDGRTVGNGIYTGICTVGHACVAGEVSRYNELSPALHELCKPAGGADDGGYYCYADGRSVGDGNEAITCGVDNSCVPGERSRYNELNAARGELCRLHRYECALNGEYIMYANSSDSCPSGKKCSPGALGWYRDSTSALSAMCRSGGTTAVFSCQGSSVCKSCPPSSPTCETCAICPSGYDCGGDHVKSGSYHDYQEAIEALCTGRAAGAGTVLPTVRYYCDSLGQNVVAPDGSQEACPIGFGCNNGDGGLYRDVDAAKNTLTGLCTKDLRQSYRCADGAIYDQGGSHVGSCETNYRCNSNPNGKFVDFAAAKAGLCVSNNTESVAATSRYYCDNLGQNVVAPNGSPEACPIGFGCSSGADGYYSGINAAKNTATGLCIKDLRTHFYCGIDGRSIYDSSNGIAVTGCPANQSCVPGSKVARTDPDGQAAMEALCRGSATESALPSAERPPAVSGSSTTASPITEMMRYDCHYGNTVCATNGVCANCEAGKGCDVNNYGAYNDLYEATNELCTSSALAKADQTPITNDLPWWV